MQRIIVIGCPGSGKSTFSKILHDITKIHLVHLDRLYWNDDGTTVDQRVFMEKLKKEIKKAQWIIDGNYSSTMEFRMKYCDTIFFLDYPLDICLEGINLRKGKQRSDLPYIEATEKEDEKFINYIKKYDVESRPKTISLLKKYSDKKIIIFKNRNEATNFLKDLLNKQSKNSR
ncbi:MAG TPA: adenylate kinase [Erysipelotrichaceae bacterium]|jgi:adenylate kinase family enzyme|nr:adenylate kinase [Erysipelotrichia bacterium]HPX33084.1 adenylate kinase [Erysipelotrichaceae bacterium]HQA84364.1 adenylate kinase [Erysipelotrichaceae bacterium]